ncbi:hypothetical protein BVX93_01200 [bacterium B13(2017)]|nr:hypothetical protein BVX93_01200 [bacterium B13(2017)]
MKIITKAFTLIELLVVMTIIIILVSIISTGAGKVRHQSRKLQCIANLKSLHCMTSLYWQEHNYLPLKWSDLDLDDNYIQRCPISESKSNLKHKNYYASLKTYMNIFFGESLYKISDNSSLLYFDPCSDAHMNYSNGIMNSGKHVQLIKVNYPSEALKSYNSFLAVTGHAHNDLHPPLNINKLLRGHPMDNYISSLLNGHETGDSEFIDFYELQNKRL